MSPEASRLFRNSELLAATQSPERSADISSKDSGAGVGAADGLQVLQTDPPPTSEKNLCGPGASQTEQFVSEGAYPATDKERSR